jgi:hypothetical protein
MLSCTPAPRLASEEPADAAQIKLAVVCASDDVIGGHNERAALPPDRDG